MRREGLGSATVCRADELFVSAQIWRCFFNREMVWVGYCAEISIWSIVFWPQNNDCLPIFFWKSRRGGWWPQRLIWAPFLAAAYIYLNLVLKLRETASCCVWAASAPSRACLKICLPAKLRPAVSRLFALLLLCRACSSCSTTLIRNILRFINRSVIQ